MAPMSALVMALSVVPRIPVGDYTHHPDMKKPVILTGCFDDETW